MDDVGAHDIKKNSDEAFSKGVYTEGNEKQQENAQNDPGRVEGNKFNQEETIQQSETIRNQDTPQKIENTPPRLSYNGIQKLGNEGVDDKTKRLGKGQNWIMIVGFLLAIITLALAGYMYLLQ